MRVVRCNLSSFPALSERRYARLGLIEPVHVVSPPLQKLASLGEVLSCVIGAPNAIALDVRERLFDYVRSELPALVG